jgi:hypothetical protein
MSIAQLGCAFTFTKGFNKQFKTPSARSIFFHLSRGPLRIMSGIDFKFLAETTFKLKPVFKRPGDVAGFRIPQLSES